MVVKEDDDEHEPFWLIHMFCSRNFTLHRVFGLAYLIQYALGLWLYVMAFPTFAASPLVWSIPATGLLQSLTAAYYFTFLRPTGAPGYFGDKRTVSYAFVKENAFFALIMLYGWCYHNDRFYPALTQSLPGRVIEAVFVFLPYAVLRPFFPKTSFREGLTEENKSEDNKALFYYGTWVTKVFYHWGKWGIGFLVNYLRYADKMDAGARQAMYGVLFGGSWSITLAIFTHTLRVKGYISGRTSFLLYVGSYLTTFVFLTGMLRALVSSPLLAALAALGWVLNCVVFAPAWVQHGVQVGIMGLLWAHREGKVDLTPYGY